MRDDGSVKFGSGGGVVEADETFIGREPGTEKKRSFHHKMKVVSLVDCESGHSKSFVVDKVNRATVLPIVRENVAREANMMTDEAYCYCPLATDFASHQSVDHSAGAYVRGVVHTNRIEGFFSIFKRGTKGVNQNCGKRHLHPYLAEFDFLNSNRVANGTDDRTRSEIRLVSVDGKKLIYMDSSMARA
jgi:hypothetical protein